MVIKITYNKKWEKRVYMSKVPYLIVLMPSCAGNWNSEVKVLSGETKEFEMCVEDWNYVKELKEINKEDITITDSSDVAIDFETPVFGDAKIIGWYQDSEIIQCAAADVTAVEGTKPRYGSIYLADNASWKTFRSDDTWGGFPKEGSNKIYYILTADTDTEPTTWSTSETADGTTNVSITPSWTDEEALWIAVEEGTPAWTSAEFIVDSATDPVPAAFTLVKTKLVNDVNTNIYVADLSDLGITTSIKATFKYV